MKSPKATRRARADQSGFTLVELLIVIIILGVLAGVAVFAVSAFTGEGVEEACQTDEQTVIVALQKVYNDSDPNAYPGPPPDDAGDWYGDLIPPLKTAPKEGNYLITWDAAGNTSILDPGGVPVAGCEGL